jgi:hypothetical protein
MRGIDGKEAYLLKTKVTVHADPGETLDAGDVVVFPKAFTNIPAATVIPVLGTVTLTVQPAIVWTATCTTTQCTITLESALPAAFWGKDIIVGVFVHEQL